MDGTRGSTYLKKMHPQRKYPWNPFKPASLLAHMKEEMWNLGAYLNSDIKEENFTLLKIEGEFVDIM